MNITAGKPIEKGKSLRDTRPRDYIKKLMSEKFSGYLCVCIHGKMGLEEGIVVFHSGKIVSSSYEYFYYNKLYRASEALERGLNALLAQVGVIDAFELTSYQVQLVLTLNEENNLEEKVSATKLRLPINFSFKYEDVLRAQVPEEEFTREEMLKRFGIKRGAGSGSTRIGLLKKAKQESE